MTDLCHLLENNRVWTNEVYDRIADDSVADRAKYFWIGCCDGPYEIAPRLGLEPRDLFIHRNLANIVCGSDRNCLGALQYAVDVLDVRDIIVCGHTRCRGVLSAISDDSLGMTDHWLSEIMDLSHQSEWTNAGAVDDGFLAQVCARNVHEQVAKLRHTRIVRNAWQRDQDLTVHGWMHDDDSGLFHALSADVPCVDQVEPRKTAVASPGRGQEHEGRAEANDAATA